MLLVLWQIVVPPLPGKALKRQLPFRGDEGIFEESFIEERRVGLEQFINRSVFVPWQTEKKNTCTAGYTVDYARLGLCFMSYPDEMDGQIKIGT